MIWRLAASASLAAALSACGAGSDATSGTTDTATPVAVIAKTGEDIFKKCAACHTVDKGGRNGIGPNLHGIAGAKVAAVEDYKYSTALTAKGGVWDDALLDAYIASPAKVVPGNKMMFAGISDAADRAVLIEYLKTLK